MKKRVVAKTLPLCLLLAGLVACAGARVPYAEFSGQLVALVVRGEDDTKRLTEYAKRDNERRTEDRSNLPLSDPVEKAQWVLDWTVEGDARRTKFGRLMLLDMVEREPERAGFANLSARPLAWNLGRTRLLFLDERERRSQVFEWERETGVVRQMTFGAPHLDASYGPDGQLAVVRLVPLKLEGERVVGGLQIWITGPGGAGARRLSDGPFDVSPRWSPDGGTLVFERRDLDGIETLQRLDPAQGGAPRLVTRGRSPVFTPDGRWLVYSARARGGLKLARIHPDGSGRRGFGSSGYQEVDPTVSPDGRFVMFVGITPGGQSGPQLVIRNLEDGKSRTINVDGEGFVPIW